VCPPQCEKLCLYGYVYDDNDCQLCECFDPCAVRFVSTQSNHLTRETSYSLGLLTVSDKCNSASAHRTVNHTQVFYAFVWLAPLHDIVLCHCIVSFRPSLAAFSISILSRLRRKTSHIDGPWHIRASNGAELAMVSPKFWRPTELVHVFDMLANKNIINTDLKGSVLWLVALAVSKPRRCHAVTWTKIILIIRLIIQRVSKERANLFFALCLSNIYRFKKLVCMFRNKYLTKLHTKCPRHLKYVLAQPSNQMRSPAYLLLHTVLESNKLSDGRGILLNENSLVICSLLIESTLVSTALTAESLTSNFPR